MGEVYERYVNVKVDDPDNPGKTKKEEQLTKGFNDPTSLKIRRFVVVDSPLHKKVMQTMGPLAWGATGLPKAAGFEWPATGSKPKAPKKKASTQPAPLKPAALKSSPKK